MEDPMVEELILPDIKALLEEGATDEVAQFLSDRYPSEVAEILSNFTKEEVYEILNRMDPQVRADVFCELPQSLQADLASQLDKNELAKLVVRLSPDDRVDLLKSLPEEQFEEVLPILAQREREDIRKLASYREGTAGSIMTTDYIALPGDLSVRQALERIRLEGSAKESIYSIFVVDAHRHLLGVIALADLILANPNKKLEEIMDDQVVSVQADADREEAVYKFSKYDLVALPVVDPQGVLVGIITHDDALDVIEQERTEDMERFMAIAGKHEDTAYLHTPIWSHFRHRVVWLVILAALGLISGAILQSFEATLTNLVILAFYMPMLADTGGNTGSQSATVVVRALALKEIEPKDTLKVLWKECGVGLLLALVLGVLAFVRVYFMSNPSQIPPGLDVVRIGLAIGLALGVQVVSATLIGALLPLLAAAVKLDPALVASPALTTVVDITGLFIYFSTAKFILGI